MKHQDLTLNHRLESWVFTNTAARIAPGSYSTQDLGRVGFQSDTGQYWRLLSTTPTWQLIGPLVPLGAAFANVQTAQLQPAGTLSTIGVMMGLGATAKLTPTASGKIHVTVTGVLQSNTANAQVVVGLSYGSGTAPLNGAALIGTATGAATAKAGTFAANTYFPFSLAAVITGRPIGTSQWFDLTLQSSAGATALVLLVTISAHEIP